MTMLPDRFEIRASLLAAQPMEILRALDAPGIAVCDVFGSESLLSLHIARFQPHALVLAEMPSDPERFCRSLLSAVPACPPRVIVCHADTPFLDASADSASLADCVRRTMLSPCAALARESLPRRERLVRDLLDGIGMPGSLLGYPCLAYAAALLSTVPPPAPPLQYALYPHLARHFSISPSAVEKRIRGAVESAWLRGSLTAQTRLLGLSVSAERGKPTNSELLYRLAESVRAAVDADTNAQ